MPDLERMLAEWRQEMRAGGIGWPEPLEELESHLREDIARRMADGADEVEAFQASVQNLGQGQRLVKEFTKLNAGRKSIKAGLLILGWLAATGSLCIGTIMLEVSWNLWSFKPRLDLPSMTGFSLILAGEAGIYLLGKLNGDIVGRALSFLVFLGLLTLSARFFFQTEHGILGGERDIPGWYRALRSFILFLPCLFVAWNEFRRRTEWGASTGVRTQA